MDIARRIRRSESRAMGMEGYLKELGLTDRVMFDAQGNSFDPQAVMIRLSEQWSHGGDHPRHTYIAPS